MRTSLLRSLALLAASPAFVFAQEAEGTRPFMRPDTGLMVWTLAIFVVLMFVLSRYAFGPLTRAVEARDGDEWSGGAGHDLRRFRWARG